MTVGSATVNLCRGVAAEPRIGRLLSLVTRLEAWLDRRKSRRALYRLDSRALADIGLTEADVGRPEPGLARTSLFTPTEWR